MTAAAYRVRLTYRTAAGTLRYATHAPMARSASQALAAVEAMVEAGRFRHIGLGCVLVSGYVEVAA